MNHAAHPSLLPVCPVVLAGGRGTRLWPLSRTNHPKQFLALEQQLSLFQQAAARLQSLQDDTIVLAPPCVVGNDEHRHLMLEQWHGLSDGPATFVLEPVGRNTAAAMTLAALHAVECHGDPVLVVTPADQTVADAAAFTAALRRAVACAAAGDIVVLGIVPDRPETGYGYIRSRASADAGAPAVVERFVEKPDAATAQAFLAAGGHHWNGGMFVVRASVWLAALEACRPDIHAATHKAWQARQVDGAFVRPGRAEFAVIPAESVDRAVLEKAAAGEPAGWRLRMVPLDAGWNDLGAWEAVWKAGAKDDTGNVAHGDTLVRGSSNSLVHATSRLVGVVGMDNVVVVETPDAVLVADRHHCQDVRQLVDELHDRRRTEHEAHRQVHRPWGWYDSVAAGPRFQVKRIQVKPGASLSLQMHHHRAEHWVVVSGTAQVTCGDRKMLLSENQSTYIPLGEVHRLSNPGTIPLEIIEVQSGSYLGEDDIVRLDDVYGRAGTALAEA
jgi:mannose-1-phosphate guanylyltransferase/mannose-6-phosphate isomerase